LLRVECLTIVLGEGAIEEIDPCRGPSNVVHSRAVARLSQAIESEDVAELKTWATNVPINGGWYSEAVVGRWDDAMVWRSLDLPTKGEIRRLLADLYDSDTANGCNGLLLLADLADL
jgi:hypothetical protein